MCGGCARYFAWKAPVPTDEEHGFVQQGSPSYEPWPYWQPRPWDSYDRSALEKEVRRELNRNISHSIPAPRR